MERLMKIFRVVTLTAMLLTIATAVTSVTGSVITGFYPGIVVLLVLTLIPIASIYYAKRIGGNAIGFQRNYYITLTIINLLAMLVVLGMTFVILGDRVFGKVL